MRSTLAAALTFWAIATSVSAQSAPVDQTAADQARAYVDELILEGQAQDYFENITRGDLPRARHKASGMTCFFTGSDQDVIRIYPPQSDTLTPGDDVGCNTILDGVAFSTYATRYADLFEPDAIMRDTLAVIQQRWPDGTPYEGDLQTISIGDGPQALVAAYTIEQDGERQRTYAMLLHDGPWSFKGRATGPETMEGLNTTVILLFAAALPGAAAASAD
jgi:hypothetical protein